MKRLITISMLVVGMTLGAVAPSFAQGNKLPLTLTCGGTTYEVTKAGDGKWATARDNNSTLVFHPTAFGGETFTFYPADGSPPQTDTDPPAQFQAGPRNGHPTFDCTFHLDFTDSSGRYTSDGSVSGYTTAGK